VLDFRRNAAAAMAPTATTKRKNAVSHLKRELILDAARRVFEAEGLEGASLRTIAAASGYTAAALYFHFDSKEALYAELLAQSLAALKDRIDQDVARARTPAARLRAAALAFFDFYAGNPRDLDLGFYLFRGGIRPHGVGRKRDEALNAALAASLAPIAEAAIALGASRSRAKLLMADTLAHASGVLLLLHTHRIRLFEAAPRTLMERYVNDQIEQLARRRVDVD
jgi:AcrR family transcriptional regulator